MNKMEKQHGKLKNMIYSATFAAIICVATMTLKYAGPLGYYHSGDAFIYLAAVCLPFPYAPLAGAIGGSLADLISGYAMYIPATFIIKFIITLSFTAKNNKILCRRNLLALLAGAAVTIAGYYIAELIIQKGNFIAAGGTLYGNIAQSAVSSAIFVVLSFAASNLRKRIFISENKNKT
jgi:uncharacterized repeat protein (TIGR04002 family)